MVHLKKYSYRKKNERNIMTRLMHTHNKRTAKNTTRNQQN